MLLELQSFKKAQFDDEEIQDINEKVFRIIANVSIQKWYIPIKLVIKDQYTVETIALFDI